MQSFSNALIWLPPLNIFIEVEEWLNTFWNFDDIVECVEYEYHRMEMSTDAMNE